MCERVFTVTSRPIITVREINIRACTNREPTIPLIKVVREDLGCSLLKAKKIVELIRMTDDEIREAYATLR